MNEIFQLNNFIIFNSGSYVMFMVSSFHLDCYNRLSFKYQSSWFIRIFKHDVPIMYFFSFFFDLQYPGCFSVYFVILSLVCRHGSWGSVMQVFW